MGLRKPEDLKLRQGLERMARRTGEKWPGTEPSPLEEIVAGEVLQTERGPCYRTRTVYSEDYRHGLHTVHCALLLDSERVCVAGKDDSFALFDARSSLFLDTETTGLAGGSGTYPFLVGLGYFRDDIFVVDQLFMRDFDEEGAVLAALTELASSFQFVVTYNGKSFDVPLLETRMIMNGMPRIFDNIKDLDLLYAARRIWGRGLPDCTLTSVERKILGMSRRWDIRGEEVPERYFEYIRSGDAAGLKVVFEHNRNDILMLPALLGHICSVMADANCGDLSPLDLYSIGRVYDSMKKRSETLRFYAEAVKGLRGSDRADVECHLAMSYKRLKRWAEAASTWSGLLGRGLYEPYEELAKYYEHVKKDLEEARNVVQEALDTFAGTRREESLRYRLCRIERKLADRSGHDD